jgi:hypothetical protein
MSIRSSRGPEIRLRYRSSAARSHRHSRSASPRCPHKHRCVPFLLSHLTEPKTPAPDIPASAFNHWRSPAQTTARSGTAPTRGRGAARRRPVLRHELGAQPNETGLVVPAGDHSVPWGRPVGRRSGHRRTPARLPAGTGSLSGSAGPAASRRPRNVKPVGARPPGSGREVRAAGRGLSRP